MSKSLEIAKKLLSEKETELSELRDWYDKANDNNGVVDQVSIAMTISRLTKEVHDLKTFINLTEPK